MKILYEDKYLLVVEKPVGVESQLSSKNKEDKTYCMGSCNGRYDGYNYGNTYG